MRLWIVFAATLTFGPALFGGAITLTSSNSTLDQLDWAGSFGSGDSLNGELAVSSSLGSGYLNALDGSGNWIVQNLPVGLAGMLTDRLNLPGGTTSGSNLSLTADLSATPLAAFNASIASGNSDTPSTLTVAEMTQRIGGTGTGDNEDGVSLPAGTASFNAGGSTSLTYQTNHPNIEAGINQCAPAAVANSLTWLGLNDVGTEPGSFGNPPDSLVAQLDDLMGRDATACNGPCGVWPLDGKLQYLNGLDNPNVIVNFQDAADNPDGDAGNGGDLVGVGGYQAGDGNQSGSGIAAMSHGTPTFDFIQSELAAGEDVEVDIRFPCTDSNGNPTGETCRHYVEITGAGTILGQQWISSVSDQEQGQAGGTDTTQFDWVSGASALPGWGDGAEIDQVISESVTPEPGTMMLIGLGLICVAGARRFRKR